MSKNRFDLDYKGVGEILRSDAMKQVCKHYAEQVKNRAGGDGYEVTTYTGATRVNASVHAVSSEALNDVYQNNSLVKALGG